MPVIYMNIVHSYNILIVFIKQINKYWIIMKDNCLTHINIMNYIPNYVIGKQNN